MALGSVGPVKVDLAKTLDGYRARAGVFDLVDLPPRQYLMVDGHGDPNSAPYAEALAAIYPLAYKLKFASARERGRDYVVPPLEALWTADDLAAFTSRRDKTRWDWTVLLFVPEWLGAEDVEAARAAVPARTRPARLDDVRLETLAEGSCVQTLHVGPYDDEAATLAHLHDVVIPGLGLTMTGRHHEIYLGDPRRVAPERLRTILRQPVTTPTTQENP